MLFLTVGLLTLFTLFASSSARVAPYKRDQTGSNLAVYYGQGANQKLLGDFCQDDAIDIVPIGFVDVLPGNPRSVDGYPGLNFGNQCGGGWVDPQGNETGMFKNCWQMIPEIQKCQAAGKKILLSIGGDTTVYFQNETAGADFARFMWGAFGPYQSSWTGPRPFGQDVVLDGFDFDIETGQSNSPVPVDSGLVSAANTFRQLMGPGRLITAAPQCIVPDAIFKNVLNQASFDAVFIQFYNTPYCSARSEFDHSFGNGISYDDWVNWLQSNSFNKSIKAYIGLPAYPDNNFYLQPSEVQTLVNKYRPKWPATFGGIMLWEATSSDRNQIQGSSYAQVMKKILQGKWSMNSTQTSTTHSSATTMTTLTRTTTVSSTTTTKTKSTTTVTTTIKPSSTTTTVSVKATTSSATSRPSTTVKTVTSKA